MISSLDLKDLEGVLILPLPMLSNSPSRYVVLDIEPVRGYQHQGRWILSEVQVAKESDFGRNDKIYFAKTHLGHLLNPGIGMNCLGQTAKAIKKHDCIPI